jgi:hypothetical protein
LNYHRQNSKQDYSCIADNDSTGVMAIQSLTKMIVQTVELGESNITRLVLMFPFWTTYMPYIACTILVNSANVGLEGLGQAHGVRILKCYLRDVEKRWRIAGLFGPSAFLGAV